MNNTQNKNKIGSELEARLEALTRDYEKLCKKLDENKAGEKEKKRMIRDITPHSSDELVELRLFRDGEKYRDDVLVGINGYMCRIKRGAPVRLKRCFAKVIADSEDSVAKVNTAVLMKDGKMERYI